MSDPRLRSTIATKLVPIISLLHRFGEESRAEVNRIATQDPSKLLDHPSLRETAKTYQLIEAAESFIKAFVGEASGKAQTEPVEEPVAAPVAQTKSESESNPAVKPEKKKRPYNRKGNWGGARPNAGRKPSSASKEKPAKSNGGKKPRDYSAEHARRKANKGAAAQAAPNKTNSVNDIIKNDWDVTITKGGIKW